MRITVEYTAQLKRAAGTGREEFDLPEQTTARDAIREIAGQQQESLGSLLLTDGGDIQPSLLLFVGDQQVGANADPKLTDGQTLTIMTPISGG